MRNAFLRAAIGIFRLMSALALCVGLVLLGWACYHYGGALSAFGAVVLALAAVIIPAYRSVPTLKLGMVTFLGLRTGRVLGEGPNLVIPFFESVILFDREVRTLEVNQKYFCADNLAVIIGGRISWQIDESLLASAFVMNQKMVEEELVSAIKSELGPIAGANSALQFKGSWEALENLLNCSLRMSAPPHIAKGVLPGERLNFYADAGGRIWRMLEPERRDARERSELENRCGVRVIRFVVSELDYTIPTGSAMEEEGQAILRTKARQVIAGAVKQIATERTAAGLKPAEAEQAAEVAMDLTKRDLRNLELGGLERFRPFEPPQSFDLGRVECRSN